MKRAMVLLLCFVFTLTLFISACSKGDDKPAAADKPATADKPADKPAETGDKKQTADNTPKDGGDKPAADAKDDGKASDGKYDPPITLSTVRVKAPTVKYADGDSVDNNPWTRTYEEQFGIKIKTLWEVDSTQLEQKMNLTIASGDIPDFFHVTNQQFKQLLDADLIEDMTDSYDKYASDRVKKLMNEGGDLPLKSATFDGKLMAIPFTFPSKEGSPMVWIRSDWLRKLNLPEPATMQDLLAISEAFTTKDPNGNNKNDTFGIALDKDFATLNGFLNGYHAYRGIWTKDASGKLTYGSIQPAMKQALQQLQVMFKAGQIDPEFGSKAYAKVGEDLTNGKIGILFASPYSGLWPLQAVIDKDPKAEWKTFPLPSIDGDPAKNQIELGVNGYWVVKKGVKHPEALLKMLDLWISIFYENKDDSVNTQMVNAADGTEIWQMNAMAAYRSFKNVDQRLKVIDALKTGDTSNLTGDDKGVYDKIKKFQSGDRSMWAWDKIFGDNGSMAVSDYYRQKDLYVSNEFYGAALPASVDKGPTLSKLENETFTKIILGTQSIDAFDKFVESWKKLGGDEVTNQVNEWAGNK